MYRLRLQSRLSNLWCACNLNLHAGGNMKQLIFYEALIAAYLYDIVICAFVFYNTSHLS